MVPKEWRISIPYRKLLPIDASLTASVVRRCNLGSQTFRFVNCVGKANLGSQTFRLVNCVGEANTVEIATAFLTKSLAMTEGRGLPRLTALG